MRSGLEVSAMAVVLVLAGTAGAAAQMNSGDIVGVVRDAQGGVLPGALVSAEHLETRTRTDRTTDGDGRFLLSGLRSGSYTVSVDLAGFRRVVQPGLTLRLGQTIELDVRLQIGGVAEAVTVSAEIPLLQTASAEISDVIDNRQVMQMPLSGRTVLSLARLTDAVVLPPGGTRGDALQQAGPLPNVGGQRSGHNIYLLDGVKVTDELFNNLVINPSLDAVQEIRVQKSQYPAEFGGKASALINVSTRAGSDAHRGSLFEFFRHEALDAHNFFDNRQAPVPPLRQNQFGGTLGGPIRRSQSFYFVSYEGQRVRRSLTRTFSVPSAALRSGDFSGFAPLCDPLAPGRAAGGCTPFPGNRIDPSRIDPIAAGLLEQVPLPTSEAPVQNLVSIGRQRKTIDQIGVRVDHRFSSRDQVFARFSTFDADEVQPFGTSALQESLVPGFGRTVGTRARNLGVSHTHVFGTRIFNEARVGWLTVDGGQDSLNRGVDFAGRVGLLGVTSDPRDVGYPQITTGGQFSTMGDPTSFVQRANEHVEVYDNLLLDRGAHRVKIGGYLFHLAFRPTQPDNARGAFNYTGQFSGNAFADFLLGYPGSAIAGSGRGDEDGRTTWAHAFAQDDWRVTDDLTINLGLRYEYNQHMRDVNNRLSSVDLDTPGGRVVIASDDDGVINADPALLARIPIPYASSASLGWDRGLLSPSLVRLAPRTGLAWSLFDDRAVLRGGYGIFLNQWAYSVQTAFARNLPFFFTRQVDVPLDRRVPTFATRDMLTADPTGVIGASIMDYAYAVEYTQTWTAGLQYQFPRSLMVEANYMGSWTLGADNATVRNVPEPGAGPIQARRPIPQLGVIRAIRFDGKSLYHGLSLKAEQRLRGGLAYALNYTLSISTDDASSPGPTEAESNVPQNVRNVFSDTGEWARSSFDHRHVVVASAGYQLPGVGRAGSLADLVLGGWRVNGILQAQTGSPFTVNLAVDNANIGAGPAQRPDQLRNPNLPGGQRTSTRWFDTEAFAMPAPFTFGSAPRNSVIGPGYASVDAALSRTWATGTAARVELRLEMFNLFNRANFDLPNRVVGSPAFGRIFSAQAAREAQIGLRITF